MTGARESTRFDLEVIYRPYFEDESFVLGPTIFCEVCRFEILYRTSECRFFSVYVCLRGSFPSLGELCYPSVPLGQRIENVDDIGAQEGRSEFQCVSDHDFFHLCEFRLVTLQIRVPIPDDSLCLLVLE